MDFWYFIKKKALRANLDCINVATLRGMVRKEGIVFYKGNRAAGEKNDDIRGRGGLKSLILDDVILLQHSLTGDRKR